MNTARFLVTGTGRCGTMYAAFYLQAKGLDMPHEEKVGSDGVVSWRWTAAWHMPNIPTFDRTLHIVREPLDTISSLAFYPDIWQHIIINSPVRECDSTLLRCMKHWHYWNLMAEAKADRTMKIEDWSMATVADYFGLSGAEPDIPKNVHTKRGGYVQRTWADLRATNADLTRLIRKQAERYGYNLDDSRTGVPARPQN